jgi:hypothetical protein
MTPAAYDLKLYRGDTTRFKVMLWQDTGKTQPVDLTGATPAAEIRDKTAGVKITTLTCTVSAPGEITVELLPAGYVTVPSSGVWDLQVTFPSGDVRTMVAGKVTVTGDVTA